MSLIDSTAPASLLAGLTTAHVCLLAARQHRSQLRGAGRVLLLPAFGCATAAWVWPDPAALGAACVLHALFFCACERWCVKPEAPTPSPSDLQRVPVTVPVLAVIDQTPDIRTFRLARPEGITFRAGQFLTVRVEVDGKFFQRAYSISSAPEAIDYLEISVKRIGRVSNALHDTLRPGGSLTVRPPAGTFIYPEPGARPLLLVAGGVGITPLISMVRHAVATEPRRPVTLLYSVRSPEDLAFGDELRGLQHRHAPFRLGLSVTRGPASDQWHRGRISEAFVRAYAPAARESLVFICGPEPMIDATKGLLAQMGVPPSRIHSESFGAASRMVNAEAAGEAAQVRFARTGCVAQVAPGQTLLEAAELHGVDVPSLCRSGVCQTCRTRLIEGSVDCESDALPDREREEGYLLPCVSRPLGDCTLEA